MNAINTLYFEKISQFDRIGEPVTVSIPFRKGALVDPERLIVRDGDEVLPVQTHPLAAWPGPNSGVKWLLVHMQPNLPGNRDKMLRFEIAENPSRAAPSTPVTVREIEHGIRVSTGPLEFTVPDNGFYPVRNVSLKGNRVFESPFGGFELCVDGRKIGTGAGTVELEVEERGPIRAVIGVTGRHRNPDGVECLDFRGRITAWAGKPYIEVEHQFIHAEEDPELRLEELRLEFEPGRKPAGAPAPRPGSAPHIALGQGYYRTEVRQTDTAKTDEPLEMLLDTETILYQSNEHFIDSFYGDFWARWNDADRGLTLSVHQAHQNFPKKLSVNRDGIVCGLYPPDAPAAPVLRGVAKTHRIQLHFHEPEMPIQESVNRSLQFQLPDRPSLSRGWMQENNPWHETFFPRRIPSRLITHFNNLHDGRPKALGMFHFGDAPDAGYTNQGRGRGQTVWVNNEYDRPHACALYYGLTGQRRVLDSCVVTARHWCDVDFCHYDPDPLVNNGLKLHTRYHVTGGVTPSHEWTEGLLDYYHLTGRREGLETARSVAENIVRHMRRPEMQEPGSTAVREGGWALRAMVGMYLGTGEAAWKDEATRLIRLFLDWHERYGALLAPYTSHSMPRVAFMISLTVNSFSRYLLVPDAEPELTTKVKRLIVETVDDMLAHCLGPDGIASYKELPSLQRTAPTFHLLEALTHAYRITREARYLQIAARHFAAAGNSVGGGSEKYADESGAVIVGRGGGRPFADRYISLLIFAAEAAPLGLLEWYEYPFADVE